MRMHRAQAAQERRHGGAVIVVVLSLMTTLVFLGLFFFGWSSQEVANAELFAAPDAENLPEIDPLVHLERAAEQLIVGTRAGYETSALWGGMHSMLAHEIGRITPELKPTDTNVATGAGIITRYVDANNDGRPDFNNNGLLANDSDFVLVYPDPENGDVVRNLQNLVINYSPIAQPNRNQDAFNQSSGERIPYYRPDVDYTYPDINSLFLAHDEAFRDPTGTVTGEYRIQIPSFFRPQLFLNLRNGGSFEALYTDGDGNNHQRQTLRPHRKHSYANGDLRYLETDTLAQSGNKTRMLKAFPNPDNGLMGIFTNPSGSDGYSFLDVDLDQDGEKDAIWMDLGLPMLTLSGGQQFVPLASFKVIDADGLLNLNAHGNTQGAQHLARDVGSDDPVSVSNLGMSRSEINPVWALNGSIPSAEQDEALKHIQDRFGAAGISAANEPHKLGNMELFMLLTGWQPSTNSEATPGRHGDTAQVEKDLSAMSGAAQSDDDNDSQSTGGYGQPGTNSPGLLGRQTPGFVHPLAPTGLGLPGFSSATSSPSSTYYLTYLSGNGATRTLGSPLTDNPAAFPQYGDFQQLYGSRMLSALPGLSNRTITGNELVDEEDETILEPGSLEYGLNDLPFPASENAALQLHQVDLDAQPVYSRATTLAAANFLHATKKVDIRKRFTTDSWDRLEFDYAAPYSRSWELGASKPAGIDTDWMENGIAFPPYFNVAAANIQPFRREIRELFRTVTVQTDSANSPFGNNRVSPRHRLNINKILSNDNRSYSSADKAFVNGSPRYRDLVPHPASLTGGTMSYLQNPMHHSDQVEPVPFNLVQTDVCAQEWWARYDRQRLARDLYCLLWTVGFDQDPSSLPAAERERRAREMAQFAVNTVDAMDRDNVISDFAYDDNLTDGWNTDPATLKHVYGVEQQELAFSEVFFIRTLFNSTDAPITEVDESYERETDEETRKYHSFVELRNAAPWDVHIDNSTWRLRRVTQSDPPSTLFTATFKDINKPAIPAGGDYLIGCQDGSNKFTSGAENGQCRPSDFRVDISSPSDGTFELIIPNNTETSVPTENGARTAHCDLDLMYTPHSGRFKEGAYTEITSLLNQTNDVDPNSKILLVLERRLYTDVGLEDESDTNGSALNPWVEVDRIEGTIRDFNSTVGNLSNSSFSSQERREPFNPGKSGAPHDLEPVNYNGTPTTPTDGQHTMPFLTKGGTERRNSVSPAKFNLWQPHFDRDFSSVMELLSVPLFGYRESIGEVWNPDVNGGPIRNIALPADTTKLSGHRTAAVRFLNPQAAGDTEMPMPTWLPADGTHYPNRWYRLLEFLEVKSQDQLNSDALTAVQRRTPGKINLNTVRDERVFAGLIDDPYHLNPAGNTDVPTRDRIEGNDRLWYFEHRRLRDGFDPLLTANSMGNILIPGSLNARPFRSLSYLQQPIDGKPDALSIESTILRHRDLRTSPPVTYTDDVGHGLYDAQSSGALSNFRIDYHTKNRILAKIHNNSTTRSHVFFAWIGIDFFEAHVNTNNLVQIGGKSPDLPQYRMFCVIDMSRLEEAYDPARNTFDFQKFIIYRQLLQ